MALADQGDELQGMAWQSKLKVYTSLNDYADMATAVVNDGMQFSNHSYSVVAGWGEKKLSLFVVWPTHPGKSHAPSWDFK